MYTPTLILTALLAATALAAPRRTSRHAPKNPMIAFSLTNDQTGTSTILTLPVDSEPHRFGDLFADTALVDAEGILIATSLQRTTDMAQGRCTVSSEGEEIGALDEATTYLEFDGSGDEALEMDVTDVWIVCEGEVQGERE
ncbi:hypothetical protein CC80DRAFT_577043 [Byssothecium circinans]|uniref:Uncharacterized protein n=1 Tax=Byssothecium circinans TaxID=147558 RepID=A0A6A5TFC5_9PLEO|nr:hypothetical protein CC80DRAFT_577043 [Byssothecium circinans]